MTIPSVGRVVHYVSYGTPGGEYPKACRAADVTEVAGNGDGGVDGIGASRVGLMVKNPTGLFFHSLADGGCAYDGSEDPAGGTWHWPERV
jgi:hypothetical protein